MIVSAHSFNLILIHYQLIYLLPQSDLQTLNMQFIHYPSLNLLLMYKKIFTNISHLCRLIKKKKT